MQGRIVMNESSQNHIPPCSRSPPSAPGQQASYSAAEAGSPCPADHGAPGHLALVEASPSGTTPASFHLSSCPTSGAGVTLVFQGQASRQSKLLHPVSRDLESFSCHAGGCLGA